MPNDDQYMGTSGKRMVPGSGLFATVLAEAGGSVGVIVGLPPAAYVSFTSCYLEP